MRRSSRPGSLTETLVDYATRVSAKKLPPSLIRIPAGKAQQHACRRFLDDLKRGPKRGLIWREDLAARVIRFFSLLHHSKGEWAGQSFKLSIWQMFVVANLFGWTMEDGSRRFRFAYIEVPRKNGKSTFAAGIGLYLFIADGEAGAEVYTAATKRDQARIVHGEAVRMVKASPALAQRIGIYKDNLSFEPVAAKYEPLGADADTMDGLNVHGAIIDELHAHKSRAIWDVLLTARGARRQPLIFVITTAGIDLASICWEQHDYAVKVCEGSVEDDSYFGFICAADAKDDWRKPATWEKANPNYGSSVKVRVLEEEVKMAIENPAAQNAFRRLHLDQWTEQSIRYIPMDLWLAAAVAKPFTPEELEGRICYGGLDLSSTIDLASFALVFPPSSNNDEYWRALVYNWCPQDSMQRRVQRDHVPYDAWAAGGWLTPTPGDVIDYDRVRNDILSLGNRYTIQEIGVDPWNATQVSTQLTGDGFTLVNMRQGWPTMSPPTKELMTLLLAHRLLPGNNPIVNWAASNLAVLTDPAGNVKPNKAEGKSIRRIDPMVALIMALGRASLNETGVSVYQSRGLLTI